MGIRNGMILALISAVCLAVYFQNPIPSGFSRPWLLQTDLTIQNLMSTSVTILDDWGICSYASGLRWVVDTRFGMSTTPPRLSVEDDVMDGVPVRVYRKRKEETTTDKLPTLVYYHGGGWFLGSLQMYHSFVVTVADRLDIIVVAVDYRLAPEHKFPIPLDDCVRATQYILTNGHLIGVDRARVAIAGDSAGGNLAAAVALRLRDHKFQPMPKLQLLIYPVLQGMDMSLPSMQQNRNGPWLTVPMKAQALSLYAMGSRKFTSFILQNEHTSPEVKKFVHARHISHDDIPSEDKYPPYQEPRLDFGNTTIWNQLKEIFESPYFAPLMASDFSGLPDTYLYTVQYDILRDEGILYGKKLTDAGVSVTHFNAPTGYHAVCLSQEYAEGQECLIHFIAYLNDKL